MLYHPQRKKTKLSILTPFVIGKSIFFSLQLKYFLFKKGEFALKILYCCEKNEKY